MKPIAGVISAVSRRMGIEEAPLQLQALQAWPEIAGRFVSGASQADRLDGGILFVTTSSAAWSQELSFQKQEILRLYREKLGRPVVRDLRFRVGRIRQPSEPEGGRSGAAIREVRLTAEELRWVREQAPRDAPDELTDAVARWLATEAKHRKQLLATGGRQCPECGAVHRGKRALCPFCAPPE